MKDYQRKKTKYILPAAVYHKTLWTIRDYHRLKDEVSTMITPKSGGGESAPPSGDPGDPTYKLAVKYSEYLEIINAIDEARNNIPREYDLGIWNNIQYGARYPQDAERSTYGHIKSRFVYEVAINLHFV